jgi:hypothetical protein
VNVAGSKFTGTAPGRARFLDAQGLHQPPLLFCRPQNLFPFSAFRLPSEIIFLKECLTMLYIIVIFCGKVKEKV